MTARKSSILDNNNLCEAYEYFLYFNLKPIDIAHELLDFPIDVLKDPLDRDEYIRAFDKGLITQQNDDDFKFISTLNRYYFEYSESHKLRKTRNHHKALEYYLGNNNIQDYVPEEFKKKMREFRKQEILSNLCTFLELSNLSRQAYSDKNYFASNMMYHMALDYMMQLRLMLDKNIVSNSDRILKKVRSENGKKGAASKANIYKEARNLALQLHDKHYNKKDQTGKFIFSAPTAAEAIKKELLDKGEKEMEKYAPGSLANVIRKHRDKLEREKS